MQSEDVSSSHAVKAESPTSVWYNVEYIDSRGNQGIAGVPATSETDAMRVARDQLAGTGCDPISAAFAEEDLRNRAPGSGGKSYHGVCLVDGSCPVYVAQPNGIVEKLDPRLDLVSHSPDGFAWGYEGSGPAQLSLALLADALGDDERAILLYQPFKSAYIASIDIDKEWQMPASIIEMLACITERIMTQRLDRPLGCPPKTSIKERSHERARSHRRG